MNEDNGSKELYQEAYDGLLWLLNRVDDVDFEVVAAFDDPYKIKELLAKLWEASK